MGRDHLISKLRHTVDVYDDINKDGHLVGQDGHARPVMAPVSGKAGIPCWVSLPSGVGTEVSDQPGGKSMGSVVFSDAIDVDLTMRLKWNESPGVITQWLEVEGICTPKFTPMDRVNPHHWSCKVSVLDPSQD